MAHWQKYNLGDHPDAEQAAVAATLASKHARDRRCEELLDLLARRHSKRMNLPLDIARRHVDRVAVTARKRDENLGNFSWLAYG